MNPIPSEIPGLSPRMDSAGPSHPLMLPEVACHLLNCLSKCHHRWETNFAQLYSLRGVCKVWKKQIDNILRKYDSLSLLPNPYLSESRQFYTDSLQAALFHMTPSSYLGSPHYYNLFEKGRMKDESSITMLISKFQGLKYLSIVELNKGILNIINNQFIRLEGLAFDLLDEASICEKDLMTCCFRDSLRILSFSFFISRLWILKLLSAFPSLEVIHFSSTSSSHVVPFEIFHSIGSSVKVVYLGNRMVTFDGSSRKCHFVSGNCQLQSLELMNSLAIFPHQQQSLLNQLSSLQYLSTLHLDLSRVECFDLLKSIGKIVSISSLTIILPQCGDTACSLFPLQDVINSNLKKLVLVGDMERPVLSDCQISQLHAHCPSLQYLCVNALLYSVKSADEYMLILEDLIYLNDLHIGYRPLLEHSVRLRPRLQSLGRTFNSFKLIHWCSTDACTCPSVDSYTVHNHYCSCSYFDPLKSLNK